ncbi:hypothetical protein [Bacillus sp. JCM 19034]|uniref:hypothetical protein n=1 Tax=Bacillus sp. JCM 19034 TaxID=1481928 RepID=UPI000783DF64|nr:hypothetical protein [Bacillus sp. JCM 19034]
MKSYNKLFFIGQSLLLVLFVISAFSFVHAEENTTEHIDCKHECEMQFHQNYHVHLDFYYDLLAEKYAPEQVDQWKEIKKERDLLKKKWKEAKKRGELDRNDLFNSEWIEKHRNIQEKFTKAVEKRDANEIQEIFPKLIAHYGEMNDIWKKALE